MSPAGYAIRRTTSADRVALERFAAAVIPRHRPGSIPTRWWWKTDPPACWIGVHEDTGEIAATCAARPASILVDGLSVRAAAGICDWYVSPRDRGRGLGRMLVERVHREHPVMFATSISESAAMGFHRLGWSGTERLPVFIGQPGAVAALGVRSGGTNVTSGPVTTSEGPWQAIDEVWRSSPGPLPAMAPRDAAFVRHHLALAPACSYRVALASLAGRPAGYALYRVLPAASVRRFPVARVGLLVDFWAGGADRAVVLRALAARAGAEMAVSGAVAVVGMATQSWVAHCLAGLGFASRRTPIVGRAVAALSPLAMHNGAGLPPFGEWHLTLADGDTDLLLGASP